MKPPNSGHFGDSDYVRSREVVPFSEVDYEATPTDNDRGVCGLPLTACTRPCG